MVVLLGEGDGGVVGWCCWGRGTDGGVVGR